MNGPEPQTHETGREARQSPPAIERERRLDELKRDAAEQVRGREEPRNAPEVTGAPGYFGQPVIKPPVWTWEIPAYFFVGGFAGGGAILALPALIAGERGLALWALWMAVIGGAIGGALLTLDLGRPKRFYNMLRVFKWRSPMSVGAWVLTGFSAAAAGSALIWQLSPWLEGIGVPGWLLAVLGYAGVAMAALLGAALITYTGVLIGATVVPVWAHHHRLLPVHFGIAGLGSAGAILELVGLGRPSLWAIGYAVAIGETLVWAWIELRRGGSVDRTLREGSSGWIMRGTGVLAGPTALVLRILGLHILAAIAFSTGALASRFGWMKAGQASARDPRAALEHFS